MLQIAGKRPIPGVMFGITHEPDGSLILREAKVLKVGIGLPRGRGLNCWIHNDGLWYFRMAVKGDNKIEFKTVGKLKTRKEAEQFYHDNYAKAEMVNYPRKIGFFTFTRPVLQQDGTEIFEPDFEAIEAHGIMPTEIDVVFLDDNPFNGAYQMWSSSELKCKGDGVNAMRVLSMADTAQDKQLVEEAKQRGEKHFPIIDGCWTCGCPFSQESVDDRGRTLPSPCHPGGDLKFQLAKNIRVGGTAYFHTSGIRSITQIFSSIERIKALTGGRLAGIPLKMVLRAYKTKHNGQPATQYGVSLEFRAEDIESLRKNLIEQAWKFRQIAEPTPPRRMIEASAEPAYVEDDEDTPFSAQAMSDEFYPEGPAEESAPQTPQSPAANPSGPSASAANATNAKTQDLADKLQQRRTANKKVDEEPATTPPPPQAPPPAGPKDGDLF